MKQVLALLAVVALLMSACSNAALNGAGKELQDTLANVAAADNKYVQMVKGGYKEDTPDLTYDDAFSYFFGTPQWKYFESGDGLNVVEFTGDCSYQNASVKARIQFVVDEEGGTFEATYLAFNEVPQNTITLAVLITKAFEEAKTAGVNSRSDPTSISISADEAERLINDWIDEYQLGSICYPEVYWRGISVLFRRSGGLQIQSDDERHRTGSAPG